MHFLDRSSVPPPPCLAQYRDGEHQWGALAKDKRQTDYQDVTRALDALQGGRCAYCEGSLGRAHVDHFEQQRRAPQLAFEWSNLFRSCMRNESCGIYKDKQTYTPSDLIKPDVDDPEHFFRFKPDGTIAVHEGLSKTETKRAEETLRVLSLDAERGPLRATRAAHVAGYVQTGLELLELAEELGEDANALIAFEVEQTKHLPYATAIKHVLTNPAFDEPRHG